MSFYLQDSHKMDFVTGKFPESPWKRKRESPNTMQASIEAHQDPLSRGVLPDFYQAVGITGDDYSEGAFDQYGLNNTNNFSMDVTTGLTPNNIGNYTYTNGVIGNGIGSNDLSFSHGYDNNSFGQSNDFPVSDMPGSGDGDGNGDPIKQETDDGRSVSASPNDSDYYYESEGVEEPPRKTLKTKKNGTPRKPRQPRPKLLKWSDNDWKNVVLGIVWACGENGIQIPFSQAAQVAGETVTAGALQQALLKLRGKQIAEGHQIPSLKMAWARKGENTSASSKSNANKPGAAQGEASRQTLARKKPTRMRGTGSRIVTVKRAYIEADRKHLVYPYEGLGAFPYKGFKNVMQDAHQMLPADEIIDKKVERYPTFPLDLALYDGPDANETLPASTYNPNDSYQGNVFYSNHGMAALNSQMVAGNNRVSFDGTSDSVDQLAVNQNQSQYTNAYSLPAPPVRRAWATTGTSQGRRNVHPDSPVASSEYHPNLIQWDVSEDFIVHPNITDDPFL